MIFHSYVELPEGTPIISHKFPVISSLQAKPPFFFPYFSRTFECVTLGHSRNHLHLVGGLEHGFYFSIYWEQLSHLTNSYFSEGVETQPPSRLIDVEKPWCFFFRSENPYLWSKQVYLLNHLRNDRMIPVNGGFYW